MNYVRLDPIRGYVGNLAEVQSYLRTLKSIWSLLLSWFGSVWMYQSSLRWRIVGGRGPGPFIRTGPRVT